jgi:DNA-binding NtrC family response regulator
MAEHASGGERRATHAACSSRAGVRVSLRISSCERQKMACYIVSRQMLLVDDDEGLRLAFAKVLRRQGYDTYDFPGFSGVLEAAEQGIGFVLITDLQLEPGMPHGLSLANMVRHRRPDMKVIFVTGYPDLADMVDEDRTEVMLKPVDQDALLAAVKRACEDWTVANARSSNSFAIPTPLPS